MPTTVPYSLLANVSWAPAKEGLGLQGEQPVQCSAAGDREMFIQGWMSLLEGFPCYK